MSLHPSHAHMQMRVSSVMEREMSYVSEFLFVDPSVDDIETILSGLRSGVEAKVLDARTPAARQIALALDGIHDLEAVHVITHGSPGRVNFSAGEWSMATLKDQAEDLAAIGRALAAGGQLRLWSCDSAAGADGAVFIDAFARAAGADVAAATGRIGAAVRGGSWGLTAFAYRPFAKPPLTPAAMSAYGGLLPTVSSGTTTINGFTFGQNYIVEGSGTLNVVNGGDLFNGTLTISSGGIVNVSSGGEILETNTISSGGVEHVSSGGTVSNTTVSSGGLLELFGGAVVNGTTTIVAGGTEEIGSGYAQTGFSVTNGVTLEVASGGTVSNTTVSSGGLLQLLSGAVVSGNLTISSGGTVSNAAISSGGTLVLFGGAVLSGTTTISSGGTEEIGSGYTFTSAVSSGATLEVASSGTISGGTVLGGGILELLSGAVISGTLTISSGGTEEVGPGYTLNGATVSSGVSPTPLFCRVARLLFFPVAPRAAQRCRVAAAKLSAPGALILVQRSPPPARSLIPALPAAGRCLAAARR
jgi:collagen type VII alpha